MQTRILKESEIDIAADIIKSGGLVAISTETVYGLAANALDGRAVSRIFEAKGRPMDNPLIVHVSEVSQISDLIKDFPVNAKKLAQRFWPGPLTIILKKSKLVPFEVSANLDTVAVRLPNDALTRSLIKKSGVPLAAPSANLSGSPSPTTAKHVLDDLDGKIDAIIDGGACSVGVESTVITLVSNPPRILRPGGITCEQLKEVLGNVEIDKSVLNKLDYSEKVLSPGMKYKHYAPKIQIILVDGNREQYINFVNSKKGDKIAALCYKEDEPKLDVKTITFGSELDNYSQANKIFDALRKIDSLKDVDLVYARSPQREGVGLAVYNRLVRAAGFRVIKL